MELIENHLTPSDMRPLLSSSVYPAAELMSCDEMVLWLANARQQVELMFQSPGFSGGSSAGKKAGH